MSFRWLPDTPMLYACAILVQTIHLINLSIINTDRAGTILYRTVPYQTAPYRTVTPPSPDLLSAFFFLSRPDRRLSLFPSHFRRPLGLHFLCSASVLYIHLTPSVVLFFFFFFLFFPFLSFLLILPPSRYPLFPSPSPPPYPTPTFFVSFLLISLFSSFF